ncbi:MBL fold metallo-hydrolase [Paraburkholderia sp. J76]|uniref:MBL fold metallo-hydrolase n=1 Tax=Paraburkholderia sp. J76 TaxID=2805439 RepID=UPI002ABE9ED9|nr:MBL fold metallo-hydrolase [Paraburkholderia sp. J76]
MSRDDSMIPRGPGAALRYPFAEAPAAGQAVEVAPSVLWMRLALPVALAHVNVWAIEDGDGWAIVDTGLCLPDSVQAWEALLAGPLGGRRVTRVFVTHLHADHVGMAGWLTRRFDCPLWMTRVEYLTCRANVADSGREAPADGVRFYRRAGWDESAIEDYRSRFSRSSRMIHPLPDSFVRLEDGARLMIGAFEWRVMVGRGHTPEHACLHSEQSGILISGDQVLPRISSNVSVHPLEPNADPLGEWLASIETFRAALPDDTLVLPSHNEPFFGLHERLQRLASGVERALERLRASLAEPKRAVDVFGVLFARSIDMRDPMSRTLATGEALAYLNYLVKRGEARVEIGPDGACRYVASAA